MQNKNENTLHITQTVGEVIKNLRMTKTKLSANKFANEYDIGNGNISRIENGKVDCKLISFWKVAEGLGMKPSELLAIIEKELGDDFKLIDE